MNNRPRDEVIVQVQVQGDRNYAVNAGTVAEKVSVQLAQRLSDDALYHICFALFGTSDVNYVRDVLDVLMHDRDVVEKVMARRTAKRIGVPTHKLGAPEWI